LRSSIARGLAGVAVLIARLIAPVAAQQIILAAAPQAAGPNRNGKNRIHDVE
jgi:hypothetical protein